MGFHLTWESDSDAGGKKSCRPSFVPPSPGSPPSSSHLLKQEYSKKKKYIIQSSEASKKKLIVAPIPIRGKSRRLLRGW